MSKPEIIEAKAKTHDQLVRIHINQHPYDSPDPTTGAALYLLGHIPAGSQLYRKLPGPDEDEPIYDDNQIEHVAPGDQFYSQEGRHKGYDIIVNAEQHHVDKKRISFEQVVRLGFPTPPPGQNILFTVTYYNGPRANSEGVLTAAQSVNVKDGMVFNVKATDRS